MKLCSHCRLEKPLDAFGKNRTRKDGLHNFCRQCLSVIDYKRKPSESTREKARQRSATRVIDPKKRAAKHVLQAAVRAGRIKRWPVCAVPECTRTKVEGHHADYDNHLGVTWLCTMHHRLAHTLIRTGSDESKKG